MTSDSPTATPELKAPQGSWKYDMIENDRRKANADFFARATPEQLQDRIIALETCLSPIITCLGALDDKPGRGMHATSNLFPEEFESTPNGHVEVYNRESDKAIKFDQHKWTEKLILEHDYAEQESVQITDGALLPDKFEVMAVHQYELCAYCSCGAYTMGDLRLLLGTWNPNSKYGKAMAAAKLETGE